MKSWKEEPHLFWEFICFSEVNGKKAKHYVWWILSNDKIGFKNNWINDCTLIAKRIEDLTNEEVKELSPNWVGSERMFKAKLISEARQGKMSGTTERELAKRGVYFLDQSHFETGEVIAADNQYYEILKP